MIEQSKHYALAIICGAKRGPKDSDLTFSPAALRDFLAAVQPAQEPVAWMDRDGDLYATEPDKNWCPPHYPLYTAPQPARQPLTDGEIWKIKSDFEKYAEIKIPEKPFRHVVRTIEAAHGIGERQ